MPFDLETYREVITDLWNNHQLKEEEIVSRLREDYQFSTDFFDLHACLEQWNLIPSPPSLTYAFSQEFTSTTTMPTQYEEEQYNPPQRPPPYYHNTYYPESGTVPDNRNTELTPLERYAQDEQPHERLAVRLSYSTSSTSSNRPHRSRKGDKGKKKRGDRSDGGCGVESNNWGKPSGGGRRK